MRHQDWTARAEAYLEAAQHLEQTWTDDAREYAQGKIVIEKLMMESIKCRRISIRRRRIEDVNIYEMYSGVQRETE